mmetsp:Transcript_43862/g.115766  ORF Transcript_43862/g.115766 Transcript_43862/m.115766 type:complete len:458 (+) Transcript_43862:73-1446(+)
MTLCSCFGFLNDQPRIAHAASSGSASSSVPWQWSQPEQGLDQEDAPPAPSADLLVSSKLDMTEVMTMAGNLVASLPAVRMELAADLKCRIYNVDGTAPHSQRLVQAGRTLADSDKVQPGHPVYLIRMQRKLAISAGTAKTIRFNDLDSGEGLLKIHAHRHVISCLAVDWDNLRCFTGAGDRTVRVWSLASGECLRSFEGFSSWIYALSVESGGGRFIALDETGHVQLFSLDEEHVAYPLFPTYHLSKRNLVYSVDWLRSIILLSSDTKASMHNLLTGDRVWRGTLPSSTQLEVDWTRQPRRGLIVQDRSLMLLQSLYLDGSCQDQPIQVRVTGRCQECGARVDWQSNRVVVAVQNCAMELWSLEPCTLLQHIVGLDCGHQKMLSIDVDWEVAPVPRVTTCMAKIGIVEQCQAHHWIFDDDEQPMRCVDLENLFKDDRSQGVESGVCVSSVTAMVAKP